MALLTGHSAEKPERVRQEQTEGEENINVMKIYKEKNERKESGDRQMYRRRGKQCSTKEIHFVKVELSQSYVLLLLYFLAVTFYVTFYIFHFYIEKKT